MARVSSPTKGAGRNAKKSTRAKKSGHAVSRVSRGGKGSSSKESLQRVRRPVKKAPGRSDSISSAAAGRRTRRGARTQEAPPPEPPPRLLSDSKSTFAALSLLEKGIRLIYQKEIKKARAELESLIEAHTREHEILVRARTYLQICDREERAHRRPPVTNDQIYALGVMDHNRGRYDSAIANFRQCIDKNPRADYLYYSLAASMALKGEAAGAMDNLRKAIELNEDNRVYAKNDSDFASLHEDKGFVEMVRLVQPTPGEPSTP
jgi:tetratricopeptide (TPR) repeat protein